MKRKLIASALIVSIINILVSIIVLSSLHENSKALIGNIEKHSVHPLHGIYEQKIFGCQPWDACHH